jgi:hypothetical protein
MSTWCAYDVCGTSCLGIQLKDGSVTLSWSMADAAVDDMEKVANRSYIRNSRVNSSCRKFV